MDIGEEGEEFVMRACTIEYLAPAVFDDLIEVYVRMARIGRTSVTYELAAYRARDDELMVTATQTLVLVDLDERKAVPIPDSYKEAIRAYDGEALETRARMRRSGQLSASSGAAATRTMSCVRSSQRCTSTSLRRGSESRSSSRAGSYSALRQESPPLSRRAFRSATTTGRSPSLP
jgi:acyl-CoA hydrolase